MSVKRFIFLQARIRRVSKKLWEILFPNSIGEPEPIIPLSLEIKAIGPRDKSKISPKNSSGSLSMVGASLPTRKDVGNPLIEASSPKGRWGLFANVLSSSWILVSALIKGEAIKIHKGSHSRRNLKSLSSFFKPRDKIHLSAKSLWS